VIFLPVAFMGGIVGRFFSSFGMTVAFAIMMSLFVSFTLTPMLCARFLKLEPKDAGHGSSKSGLVYRAIDGFYGKALAWAVRHRFTVIGENNGTAGKGQGDVTRGSLYFRIKELDERKYTQFEVMAAAREILKDYPDLRSAVTVVSAIQAAGQDTRLFQMSLV